MRRSPSAFQPCASRRSILVLGMNPREAWDDGAAIEHSDQALGVQLAISQMSAGDEHRLDALGAVNFHFVMLGR
jgi:hypothetical protein